MPFGGVELNVLVTENQDVVFKHDQQVTNLFTVSFANRLGLGRENTPPDSCHGRQKLSVADSV